MGKAGQRLKKGDFAIRLMSFVEFEAGDHTGYFFLVKRQMDQKEK